MTAPLPPAFVGPRSEPPKVIAHVDPRPLCVRVSEERGEDLLRHAQFWHDVHERESLGGCGRCSYLAAAPHRLPPAEALDSGTYADDAGRELVRRGVWADDTLLTARQYDLRTARRLLGGRR